MAPSDVKHVKVNDMIFHSYKRTATYCSPDGSSVVLRPNPAFLPKVFSKFHLSQSVELRSHPSSGETEQRQSVLCPVRALTEYIRHTQAARKTDQLFICFDAGRLGRPFWVDCPTGSWT
ncbi:hypothetical protein N1851_002643 [Merluccius polli]|uniref:Uncharacterized protein n=1 Tax=Merluccius polli TaxID=89951 RepID=A0AA47NB83_MERPO|nr:hypothetical protein N1851_002643 [Merluccius polli]